LNSYPLNITNESTTVFLPQLQIPTIYTLGISGWVWFTSGVDTPTQASNTPPMQDKDSATPEVFRTEMHDESSTAQPLDYSKTKVPVYDKGRLSYCMTMSFGL
jgi:hypothetical protein